MQEVKQSANTKKEIKMENDKQMKEEMEQNSSAPPPPPPKKKEAQTHKQLFEKHKKNSFSHWVEEHKRRMVGGWSMTATINEVLIACRNGMPSLSAGSYPNAPYPTHLPTTWNQEKRSKNGSLSGGFCSMKRFSTSCSYIARMSKIRALTQGRQRETRQGVFKRSFQREKRGTENMLRNSVHYDKLLSWLVRSVASNQALPALDTSHATCCYWRLLGKGPGIY